MKIKALLFDFDGLILDTETPEFQVWQAIYREYGQEFPAEQWGQIVGGGGEPHFDAAGHLVELAGDGLNADLLRARHKIESEAWVLQQPVLPGVMEYLDDAQQLGLRLAVASSSPHSWVDTHLARLGLVDRFPSASGRGFDVIICGDDVPPGRTKPYPDIFLKALDAISVNADEAIVFEDSPNGVKAARMAGIYVVSVPNPMTAMLKTDGANLALSSLADMSLGKLLENVNGSVP
ncbi:MAG: HAD-IA family hydrolase [Anaerolineales bacterium]|jgi:beta-phosphoglucomutase-like phosphatase (HAD superfamily)